MKIFILDIILNISGIFISLSKYCDKIAEYLISYVRNEIKKIEN